MILPHERVDREGGNGAPSLYKKKDLFMCVYHTLFLCKLFASWIIYLDIYILLFFQMIWVRKYILGKKINA